MLPQEQDTSAQNDATVTPQLLQAYGCIESVQQDNTTTTTTFISDLHGDDSRNKDLPPKKTAVTSEVCGALSGACGSHDVDAPMSVVAAGAGHVRPGDVHMSAVVSRGSLVGSGRRPCVWYVLSDDGGNEEQQFCATLREALEVSVLWACILMSVSCRGVNRGECLVGV
jgi:hypothetical protein